MERPNGTWQPKQRQITGEVMYIQDRWQNGQQVGDFAELPEGARRMYEEDAALMVNLGGKPRILDLYDEYDKARSELSRSCEALAEELLESGDGYSGGAREVFSAALLPREVYAKLKQLRVAEVLATDDEDLAALPGTGESSERGVRKADGVLTDAYIRVWKHGAHRKRVVTSEPGVEPQYPRDFLAYPSDEMVHGYLIEIGFEHYHPTAGAISETVGLYIDEEAQLHVVRDMYILGFGAAASGGLYAKVLSDVSELDMAAFADFIAEIVGDEPTPMWRHDRFDDMRDYIDRVANGLTRAYLKEWLDNTSSAHVRFNLSRNYIDGVALRDALMDSHNSRAHDEVVAIVDRERELHNARIENSVASTDSDAPRPWRDHIER